MLSIEWILKVSYYLKKVRRRKRKGGGDPDDPDEPGSTNGDGTPDFDFDLRDAAGRWWGSGASLLGLVGDVQEHELESLSNGFSPSGEPLIQNAGSPKHQKAWDLTFSAPKYLSVLWSTAEPETQKKIEELHRQAVDAALEYLTEVAILTRRGKGGMTLEHALPIVARFDDAISRAYEPQFHTHCLLLNVAGREDGTFGTILSKPFYRHKLTAGAIYQAELAHLLRSVLRLRLVRTNAGYAIVGVPQKLVDHYSTRSKQKSERLKSKGFHSAKAAKIAVLDTRKAIKEYPSSEIELRQLWRATNEKHGFTEATVLGLLGKAPLSLKPPKLKTRIAKAIRELLETESCFSEQQLIRHVAEEVVAEGVAASEIITQVREFLLQWKEIVPLAGGVDPLFTTREIVAMEKKLKSTIRRGAKNASHVIDRHFVESLLDQYLPLNKKLTEDEAVRNLEQRRAALKVIARSGIIQVLEGMAGAGKTFTLYVIRMILEQYGFRVIAMAPSAQAAAKLQESTGIESTTIAARLMQLDYWRHFFNHHKRQFKRFVKGKWTYAFEGPPLTLDSNTVVIIDEASMVGTKVMATIFDLVTKAGAKLILVGDRQQLQPIEAGAPFRMIADLTGKAVLSHVVRQKLEPDDPNPAWHRQAGELIASGHIAPAIKLFAERGRLQVLTDRQTAMESFVRDWSVGGISSPIDHIGLAGTRDEVKTLNQMCQSARLNAGALGDAAVEIGKSTFRVGDVVLFRKNSRVLQVNNGDRGVIVSFNRRRKMVAVRLDRNQETVVIPYQSYTTIDLGYVMTTHTAQGLDVLFATVGGRGALLPAIVAWPANLAALRREAGGATRFL